jgi:hypothetical protein
MNNLYNIFMNVIEFNQNDFKKRNNHWYFSLKNDSLDNKYGFVVFYSTTCIICQQMKDFWSELSIKFNNVVFFGAVNCSNSFNESIIFDFHIDHYPVLYWIDKDTRKLTEYKGKINYETIQIFIYSKLKNVLLID